MEIRHWWFKIETYHGTVTILFIPHGSSHTICVDLMSEVVIDFRIQG